jgi:hypothetical protein
MRDTKRMMRGGCIRVQHGGNPQGFGRFAGPAGLQQQFAQAPMQLGILWLKAGGSTQHGNCLANVAGARQSLGLRG